MTLHLEYLAALERVGAIQDCISATQLRGHAERFVTQRWIVEEGHQTHVLVSVLGGEDEIEVEVDKDASTYSYVSPERRPIRSIKPLSEIMLYAFNVDAWFDKLADIFEIETSRRPSRRTVLDSHLWHLGDLRVGRTHEFAPLYIARRLEQCPSDWHAALLDSRRPSQGVVLTASDVAANLPNGHQACDLGCVLVDGPNGPICNREVLDRLLRGIPTNDANPDEYFEEKAGRLKLKHLDEAVTFIGVQKKIIKIFWKARNSHPLKWADIKSESGSSAKGIDRAFGKNDPWTSWIERVGHGKLRIRAGNPPS